MRPSDGIPAFGCLNGLMADPAVTDVTVTCEGRVWADRGAGMVECHPTPGFSGPQAVRDFAVQVCSQLGRRLDDASPMADASTAGGIRLHAVIAPIVPVGASISIRLPGRDRPGLEGLIGSGLCPPSWYYTLKALVSGRASILISGGTGSGKTTLLRALLAECPCADRLVTVEETRELEILPGHADHVALAIRETNVEGAGGIDLARLIRATLRMRPDRIILGECRGGEVADLLRAFNSGHRGGMVTLHADGVERVPARLATLGLLAGLEPRALSSLAEGAFDAVIHMERTGGRRRIAQIGVLALDRQGSLSGRPLCIWEGEGGARYLSGWATFARRWGIRTVTGTSQGRDHE